MVGVDGVGARNRGLLELPLIAQESQPQRHTQFQLPPNSNSWRGRGGRYGKGV